MSMCRSEVKATLIKLYCALHFGINSLRRIWPVVAVAPVSRTLPALLFSLGGCVLTCERFILRATHARDPRRSLAAQESAWRLWPTESATGRQLGRPKDRAYLKQKTHSSSALPVRGKHLVSHRYRRARRRKWALRPNLVQAE